MSITYPDLPNTQFPESSDIFNRFMDVSATMQPLVEQYYTYYNNHDYVAIEQLITDNPILTRALINADNLNNILDALVAMERFYLNDVENYIFNVAKDKGTWSSTTKYTKWNIVDYMVDEAIQSYQCIELDTPINTKPTDSNYWKPITMRGKQGTPGIGLVMRGHWTLGVTYGINSMVVYNNSFWWSLKETQAKPILTSADWELIYDFSYCMKYDNTNSNLQSDKIQDAIDELDHALSTNYYKIDEIDAKNQTYTITIPVTSWSNAIPFYTNIRIDNILSSDNPIIDLTINENIETGILQNEEWTKITRAITKDREIAFYCYEEVPIIDLTCQIKVVR